MPHPLLATNLPAADVDVDVAPLLTALDELARAVEAFSPRSYGQSPVAFLRSGAGGHVRHCLDHVEALVSGWRSGKVDYDTRVRGGAVESDRGEALSRLASLRGQVASLKAVARARPLPLLDVCADASGRRVEVASTWEREILFVASHTTHHLAMIAVVAKLVGTELPENTGLAPATKAFDKECEACAP